MTIEQYAKDFPHLTEFQISVNYRMYCIKRKTGDGWGEKHSLYAYLYCHSPKLDAETIVSLSSVNDVGITIAKEAIENLHTTIKAYQFLANTK